MLAALALLVGFAAGYAARGRKRTRVLVGWTHFGADSPRARQIKAQQIVSDALGNSAVKPQTP